jgi:hypothetical protein
VRVSDWIALSYFIYLLLTALLKPAWTSRRRALATSFGLAALVLVVSRVPVEGPTGIVRDWAPAIYLIGGYWLSGLYFVAPMPKLEAWCLALDRRVLDDTGLTALVERAPRIVLELLESAYLACFVFVVAGLGVVLVDGAPGASDRYWSLVLIGELGAFGWLPWLQTRPPRAIEPPGPMDQRGLLVRAFNMGTLARASIQVNTLPSGHVSGSLTAAIAIWMAVPAAGPMALALAIAITVSSVVGRYHYTIDAITGVGLALLGWSVLLLFGRA